MEDFSGYYARLFERNGEIQASDAKVVALRLGEVATAVGDLQGAARGGAGASGDGAGVEAASG